MTYKLSILHTYFVEVNDNLFSCREYTNLMIGVRRKNKRRRCTSFFVFIISDLCLKPNMANQHREELCGKCNLIFCFKADKNYSRAGK